MKASIKLRTSLLLLAVFLVLATFSYAQQEKKAPASPKASVSQVIGIETLVIVEYSRPGVKGRKIWGELVPLGLEPGNKYSDNKPYPWRGGANQSTLINFSKDVVIDGKTVPAGKYSLHFIPSEKEWTVIFNKNVTLWGSYKYNPEEDQLQIKVLPVTSHHQEWLAYGFEDATPKSATVFLHWELLKVPFTVNVVE